MDRKVYENDVFALDFDYFVVSAKIFCKDILRKIRNSLELVLLRKLNELHFVGCLYQAYCAGHLQFGLNIQLMGLNGLFA